MSNQELAEELDKPIIRKFQKRQVYSSFKDNIWFTDIADMQLITKFNNGIRFLCVIIFLPQYLQVFPLKDKKGIKITNAFQKRFDESKCKPDKIWVGKGIEFYNRSRKSWIKNNCIEMYSTHNEVLEMIYQNLKN